MKNQNRDLSNNKILTLYNEMLEFLIKSENIINIETSRNDLITYLDIIFSKLIVIFSFESGLISTYDKEKNIMEYKKIINTLFEVCNSNLKSNIEIIDEIKLIYSWISNKLDNCDNELLNENMNSNNIYDQFGCVVVIVFEYGYLNKAFGEIDDNLMKTMIEKARGFRSDNYFSVTEWGEIIDIRNWKLLTQPSMETAKTNSDQSHTRNKKYSIYITGESSINEYITETISKNAQMHIWNTSNIYNTLQLLKTHNYKLGNILNIECIGNVDYIK